ncbi:MAG: SIR2 family NAD-dependent protein deacylase [Bacteroidota bacterium]
MKQTKKKLVVLSGAGISAESGLKTFRDMGGLWEKYEVTEVASPEAWQTNPALVLRFYNERREALLKARPNKAHLTLAKLENDFDVYIITQNVDDLHERAGSTKILHLHGELRKARSTADPTLVYPLEGPHLNLGDLCEKGSQLRPHVVWFGESVPEMRSAIPLVREAEVFLVIGTSLSVYPAAGLLSYVSAACPVYVIDPGEVFPAGRKKVIFIRDTAVNGMDRFVSDYIGDL